ncbi:hypothetical protein PQX77_011457 [Marasmius sp. AFHP31]|nr:hypothetical protein PQX77_011457 [Marasmius sp. AFHP31]
MLRVSRPFSPIYYLLYTLVALFSCSVGAAPSLENVALARRFAPQLRFHKDEMYFTSTVDWFLSNVKQVDSNGTIINSRPTIETVSQPAGQGSGLYLTTDIDTNRDGWLKGVSPLEDPPNVAIYTFVAPKPNGITDIYYWLFTPFNQAKDVPILGRVGDHVGDWERLAVRTVNGEATQVDYHAHSNTGSTVPFAQAPKFDNNSRPVAYVAKGSHGIWETAATHTYVDAIIFQLQDLTSDGGVYWDTRDSLVIYNFPDTFSGNDDWMNYKGAYGNKGTTDCWWYIFHDECAVVTGPPGPYRTDVMGDGSKLKSSLSRTEAQDLVKWNMEGPFSQVLGAATDADHSTFNIHLNLTTTTTDIVVLGVNVTCSSLDRKSSTDSLNVFVTVPVALKAEPSNRMEVVTPPCPLGTEVNEYNTGLCTKTASCLWGESRTLKAYSTAGEVLSTRAIDVRDLDIWIF